MIQQQGTRKNGYVFCAVSFHHATTPCGSPTQATVKTAFTHNNFRDSRVIFFPFVRQPRKSCIHVICEVQSKGTSRHVPDSILKKN